MEDKNTPSSPPSESKPVGNAVGGQRVIQPSAEILEEIKSQQVAPTAPATPVAQPTPQRPVGPTTPETPSPGQDQAPAVGQTPPKPPGENLDQFKAEHSSARIILVVRIIAGIMIVASVASLYQWYRAGQTGQPRVTSPVEMVGSLLLAIGIFCLYDIARKIYVVLASVALAIVVIAVGILISAGSLSSSFNKVQSSQTPQTTVTQHNVSKAEQDREQALKKQNAELEKRAQASQPSHTVHDIEDYVIIAVYLFIVIFPLFFFTRSRVKAVFH